MPDYPTNERNKVKRVPERAAYDRETIHAILDAAIVCHVGFAEEGQPIVIPSLHAREGQSVLLHGASSSRLMRHLGRGELVCIAATLLDGLVLARAIFNQSVNYRSAVVFGRGELVTERAEKLAALQAFSDKLLPGRWDDSRPPNAKELKATAVARVTIESASAKVRTGGPKDDADDLALPFWAGIVPLRMAAGDPVAAEGLAAGTKAPHYLQAIGERFN